MTMVTEMGKQWGNMYVVYRIFRHFNFLDFHVKRNAIRNIYDTISKEDNYGMKLERHIRDFQIFIA